jgi:hypothetical protein
VRDAELGLLARVAEPGLPALEPPDPESLDPLLELDAEPVLDAEPAAEC